VFARIGAEVSDTDAQHEALALIEHLCDLSSMCNGSNGNVSNILSVLCKSQFLGHEAAGVLMTQLQASNTNPDLTCALIHYVTQYFQYQRHNAMDALTSDDMLRCLLNHLDSQSVNVRAHVATLLGHMCVFGISDIPNGYANDGQ